MNRNKIFRSGIVLLGTLIFSLSLSCAAAVSRGGEYGTLNVAFGGARGLETGWPGNAMPSFSSVTIKVSAPDMGTVSSTFSGYSGSVSLKIPAGSGRLVEVTAVPASGAAPFFAQSYYGSATADVADGGQATVPIKLALGTSKIVLPSFDTTYQSTSTLKFADSFSGGSTQTVYMTPMTDESDFELDPYGRFFFAGNGIQHATNLVDNPVQLSPDQATDLAYDASQNRLYALYDQDGVNLRYYNVATAETTPISVAPPAGYSFNSAVLGAGIAAADGFIYANVMSQDSNYYLGKFTVPAGETSVVAELVAVVNWSNLDVTGEIRDMIVKDGVLYIISTQRYVGDGYTTYSDSLESRGRLTAISTANLAQLWETGFSETGLPSNPAKEFYGPTRFVGVAPKKLYIADEGFRWEYTTQQTANPINVDRVIEVDLDQKAITGVGLEGEATFFQDFSTYIIYSSDYVS